MNIYPNKKNKIVIAKKVEDIAADNFKKELANITFKDSSESLRLSLKNNISTMPRISEMNMTMLAYSVAFCYDNSMNIDMIIENLNLETLNKYVDRFIFSMKEIKFETPEKKKLSRLRLVATMIRYIVYYLKNTGLLDSS